jgi:hypothetical protein
MRRALVVGIACLALLLAAWGVYQLAFRDARPAVAPSPRQPAPSPPPPAAVPAPATFEILEVAGTVEVRRGDAWLPVQPGDRMGTTDAIRTGVEGRAVLRAESGDELRLRERVELEIGRLSEKTTELDLRRGKLRAEAAAGTERLQITSGEAQAVGKGGGTFTVFSDPRGAVTVASESGDTEVIAQGASVTVEPGKQTYVAPGQKPGDPVPIPDEVFLQVAWPTGEVHAKRVQVRGKAEPGSSVLVNGEPTAVDPKGVFATEVPLQEGRNKVAVVAESIDGKTRQKKGEVDVNTKGPPLQANPEQLYEKKKKGTP